MRQSSLAQLIILLLIFICLNSLVPDAEGNGNPRGFRNNFNYRNNNTNNRNYGNNFQRPSQSNHFNTNGQHNGYVQQLSVPATKTCPRPHLQDGYLEIENCLRNNLNPVCYYSEQRIPVNWKAKMVCQRGNLILKYASSCLEDGNWAPAFVGSCNEVFEIKNANSQPKMPNNSNNNFVGQKPCLMLQLRLSKNFLLTCLTLGREKESAQQCVRAGENMSSGTKVFLRCKPPYRSETNENSAWTCVNGKWDSSRHENRRKMVCVYKSPASQRGRPRPTTPSRPRPKATRPSIYRPRPTSPKPTPKPASASIPRPRPTSPSRQKPTSASIPRPSPTSSSRPRPNPTPATTKKPLTTTKTTTVAPAFIPVERPFGEMKCPALSEKKGIQIECISGGSQVYGSSCNGPSIAGTEATYTCRQYYESSFSLKVQYRTCKEDGTWTGSSDSFGCIVQCGVSNAVLTPRITFGEPTYRSQWPWYAAIFLQDKPGKWKFICGGSILSGRSVITAAHCLTLFQTKQTRKEHTIRIEVGKYRREERDEFVQIRQIDTFEIHDDYNPFNYESDIAIMILKEEINFGYHVRPVCFPQTSDSALEEQQLAKDSIGTVVGFGFDEFGNLSNELKMANLRVVSQAECSDENVGGSQGLLNSRSTTYCAGLKNKTNVCNGDSGGGMVFPLKSDYTTRWYLQGIVSAGVSTDEGKCDPRRCSVFTRVGRYASWITRTLSHHGLL